MLSREDLQQLYLLLLVLRGKFNVIFSLLIFLSDIGSFLIDRDIVEVRMDIGGVSCIVRDTAGLRSQTSDVIEQEGIKRARYVFDGI